MANRSQLSDKKQKREGSLIFSNSSAMLGAPLYSGRSGSARSQVTKVPTTSEFLVLLVTKIKIPVFRKACLLEEAKVTSIASKLKSLLEGAKA